MARGKKASANGVPASISKKPPTRGVPCRCGGCGVEFPSRNAVFKHLVGTGGICLDPSDYDDFARYVAEQRREKVLILYGYILPRTDTNPNHSGRTGECEDDGPTKQEGCCVQRQREVVRSGEDAARVLLDVIQSTSTATATSDTTKKQEKEKERQQDKNDDAAAALAGGEGGRGSSGAAAAGGADGSGGATATVAATTTTTPGAAAAVAAATMNRSYGNFARSTDAVAQDEGTSGAVTEVLTTRMAPIAVPETEWIRRINRSLKERLSNGTGDGDDAPSSSSSSSVAPPPPTGSAMRVFARKVLPAVAARFNCEMDVSQRRIEYLLPFDFFFHGNNRCSDSGSSSNNNEKTTLLDSCESLEDFFSKFPSFSEGCFTRQDQYYSKHNEKIGHMRPSRETLMFLFGLKKAMQSMTTHPVEVDANDPLAALEKELSDQQRRKRDEKGRRQRSDGEGSGAGNDDDDPDGDQPVRFDSEEETQTRQSETDGSTGGSNDETNREQQSSHEKAEKQQCDESFSSASNGKKKATKKKTVMKRKRYHNFTPTLMAHEFLAYRRLDRFYHRATLRFDEEVVSEGDGGDREIKSNTNSNGSRLKLLPDGNKDTTKRPYLALSLSGDLFLTGQVCRAVGLLLALARGSVDADFIDCVFDETYPHLVPLPAAPPFGQYACEALFMKWEGKLKSILSPRSSAVYDPSQGWNDSKILNSVDEWQTMMREHVAQLWLEEGFDSDGRLVAEKKWTEEVLEPWAEHARKQLADYRLWKQGSSMQMSTKTSAMIAASGDDCESHTKDDHGVSLTSNGEADVSASTARLPPPESIDPTVPLLYKKVLECLRDVDRSGQWPSTTPKRQMVMVSTLKEEHESTEGDPITGSFATSLAVAHMRAKYNTESRTSAYIFSEGEGGASGSFSFGAMPGQKNQPKANSQFPDLMKAAFELEIALFPNREPSSTIAVNRNAQFRPHTDSGAGAGQSTSVIVGLGTYTGGELVVEGKQVDIRYKAVEFNGWKQRHWTMPFRGERYSLVWFTPKGCEGLRGIDLCK